MMDQRLVTMAWVGDREDMEFWGGFGSREECQGGLVSGLKRAGCDFDKTVR